ncbi:glycine cleavage system aminomethyltransferase GcvT [Candidatus Xianfuyuplasma coldseepsis]|uniref:Aminomethyltransferase n=1 Tax=Candidatus Xianfuyuplasma coldseepsis TaxID=2782163 RepID=A0A7L7KW08_9MOLU|nr:glycine cleavage system aminomethyltransferase GcvT [Xianfuyuplasma coldseepsis]QMS85938.1 glycine cleavage system aminomethyltransferase GcvT [Xianfuyuplasma coldseepsis]
MKQTALYQKHIDLGAKMVDFAGWEMPISYTSITEEHGYVREKCGLFDVSHMGEICVRGKEALHLVDYIFTNDVAAMDDHQVLYGMMCYPDGGVVDDLLVYRFAEDHFLLVVNASNVDKDYAWVLEQNHFDCRVTNESDNFSEVALQGPLAQHVLQKLTQYDLNQITFFTSQMIPIDGMTFLVSRTGYTGEDGFEIYGAHQDIELIWEQLLVTGGNQIAPIGLGARDTLRFEVALPLYGNELSPTITPLEAGLSFAVKLDRQDFIGRDALVQQQEQGTLRRLCGLTMMDKGILRHGYEVYHEDTVVGVVTTGYKSPSTNETVALALIDRPYDKRGTKLTVDIRGKRKSVVVRTKKFYNKNYKK